MRPSPRIGTNTSFAFLPNLTSVTFVPLVARSGTGGEIAFVASSRERVGEEIQEDGAGEYHDEVRRRCIRIFPQAI